jgi:predicted transglutaminase-like cysteine proteinase
MDKFAPATQTPAHRTRFRAGVGLAAVILIMAATGAAAAPKPLPAQLAAMRVVAAPSAARDLCGRYPWACARGASRPGTPGDALALARAVNRAVNSEVRQVTDRSQYGREDIWGLPTARGGDCEDFALEKKRRLICREARFSSPRFSTGRGVGTRFWCSEPGRATSCSTTSATRSCPGIGPDTAS